MEAAGVELSTRMAGAGVRLRKRGGESHRAACRLELIVIRAIEERSDVILVAQSVGGLHGTP